MNEFFIAPIVEGYGEMASVPILLQRLMREVRTDARLRVNPPFRIKATSFRRDPAYFARCVELAARKAKPHDRGSVLILLDCEDDCPAKVGPELAARATAVRSDVPVRVALAHREFETWFLAAAHSLRGVRGLPSDLDPPSTPESQRDAKGWLHELMPAGYHEPTDQAALVQVFSLEAAAMIPSFRRLRRQLHGWFARQPV